MDRRMFFWIVLELVASTCSSASVSESFAVSVGDSKSVRRGDTVLMPCWLTPPQDAEDLVIRWYREENVDTPVMIYIPGRADRFFMDGSFVGRVSFDVKDSTSGGMKTGDGTLKLINVTIKDEGKYTCYVSSIQEHDSASMNLYVTETGSSPVLSAVWREDNTVNVSCESEGWFPQPELRWSEDPDKDRATFVRDSSGLIRVHSWILVSASSEVSCSVGLPNTKGLTVRLHLEKNIPPPPEDFGFIAGWIAFTILLIIMTVMVIGFMFYRKKEEKSAECIEAKESSDFIEEKEPLLPKETSPPTDLSSASQNYVNIKLENTNEFLMIRESILRDKWGITFPDGDRVTCITAIKGTPGFSHGKHYWEVSLKNPNLPVKLSWWIGVTSSPEIPQKVDFSPNTLNGFWFLSSSPEDEGHLQFSTVPQVCVPVHSRPQTVGVYLDYEKGELSFYDVDRKSFIGSLTAEFKGHVFPLFNPGKGDESPMRILQRTEQSQNVDPDPNRETSAPKEDERSTVEEDHAKPSADPLEHFQSVDTSAAAPPEGLQAPAIPADGSTAVAVDHSEHLLGIKTPTGAPPKKQKAPPMSADGSTAVAANHSDHLLSIKAPTLAPLGGQKAPPVSIERSIAPSRDPKEDPLGVKPPTGAPPRGPKAPPVSAEGPIAPSTDPKKDTVGEKTPTRAPPKKRKAPPMSADGSTAVAANHSDHLLSIKAPTLAPLGGQKAPPVSIKRSIAPSRDPKEDPLGVKPSTGAPLGGQKAPPVSAEGTIAPSTDPKEDPLGVKASTLAPLGGQKAPPVSIKRSIAPSRDPKEDPLSIKASTLAPLGGQKAPPVSIERSIAPSRDPKEDPLGVKTPTGAPLGGQKAPPVSADGSTAVSANHSDHLLSIKAPTLAPLGGQKAPPMSAE
ncbi:Butyrophilin subfamily 1 member A1 [Oryzias melastigma]|uniref:Butyrophilin subfamily 1 member A1 n=1 Tax=Oryzias melastigma TaxID=30732 RepID=A0A834BX75_ORYME|nr:Butyrophilin subfamily 1 member A1 [Oryzias melastigma]